MRLSLLLLLVVGCVRLDDAPTFPQDDPEFSAPQLAEPTGLDEDPPRALTLLPGDEVTIQAFSAEVTQYEGILVDETGRIHVPLAGDVDVGGLTLADAEERVQEAMRRLDRVVRVGLRISVHGGHQASVIGAVGDPGRVPATPGMRVADLLAAAGGPASPTEAGTNPVADLYGARLIRAGEAVPVSIPKALEGDPRHNVRIQPGDHLYVPSGRGNTITVLGSVGAAGVFAYRHGIRLTEVLARAGGLDEHGDRTDVHVVRGSLREPQAYRASLREIVNGGRSDVVLAAGDVVYVTQEWTSHVGEVLSRLSILLADPATIALAIALTR